MKKKLRHFIAFFLAFSIVFSIIAPIMAKNNINVIYAESATGAPPPPPPPQPPSPTPPPIPPLSPPEEEEEEGTLPDDDKDKQNKNDGTKTNKVTLHKLLMTKAELNAWDSDAIKDAGYNGTQSKDKLNVMLTNFGVNGVKEIAGVFFVLKNEDGTKYIGRDGNEKEQDFVLTDDKKSEVIGGVTGVEGYTFDVSNLNGTEDNPKVYTIVEVPELSTYKSDNGETLTGSKAVPVKISLPFINEQGIQDNVNVYPKNSADKPQIDKNFKANNELNIVKDNFFDLGKVGANYNNYGANKSTASATIGDEIPYEIKTQIPQDAKYKTLRWEDTMTKGLTFNKKVEVQYTHVSNLTGEKIWVELVEKFYDLSINENGFIIKLNDNGLNKIKEEAKISDVEIKLTYSAVVNKNAEVDVEDTNTIKFDYSNRTKTFVEPRDNEITNKTSIKVTKTWATNAENHGDAIVQYFLYEKGNNVEDDKVVASSDKISNGDYSYTFSNLNNNKIYYVKEVTKGYDPSYTVGDEGVTVTNTKDENNPDSLIPTSPKVTTGGKKFVKTDDTATKTRLVGAEFEIKNAKGEYLAFADNTNLTELNNKKNELDNAIAEYNKLNETDQKGQKGTEAKDKIATAQDAYNAEYKKAFSAYKWVTEENKANSKIVKVISDKDGKFEIKGLAFGENYKLVETKAPSGYALTTTEFTFNVDKTSYTTTEDGISYDADGQGTEAQRIQNKKVTIPQTGGIGTVIFVVVGLTIMGGAVLAMKKRSSEDK